MEVNEDRIRKLAGDWHGGQSSALYALCSTGHIDRDGLLREMAENRREVDACLARTPDAYSDVDLDGLRELVEWVDALPDPVEVLVKRASALGREHGTAGGSWLEMADPVTAGICLRLNGEGDPEWWEVFGPASGPLSGEWADGMTPDDLYDQVGMPCDEPGDPDNYARQELRVELENAYEQAYYEAWRDEVLRMARRQVGES